MNTGFDRGIFRLLDRGSAAASDPPVTAIK
jgi:hypothetical protein